MRARVRVGGFRDFLTGVVMGFATGTLVFAAWSIWSWL